jgi:ABC-type transport system involved in multi-copper enzyme maturation permease subunit
MGKQFGSCWSQWLSGSLSLAGLSLRRLVWSRQTVVSLFLLGFGSLVVIAWSLNDDRTAERFTEQILLPLYVSFLLPIFCLCYAASSIAGDREDQTLVFLLVTPLPRPAIYTAKYVSALLLTLVWTLGAMAILCQFAGRAGREAFVLFWPAVLWSTLAYVGLFCLFSVVLHRATIVALAYSVFLETLLGNMPGTIKRLAISFYTQCLIFDAGIPVGLDPSGTRPPGLFLPVTGQTAHWVLWVVAVGMFVASLCLFQRREYS